MGAEGLEARCYEVAREALMWTAPDGWRLGLAEPLYRTQEVPGGGLLGVPSTWGRRSDGRLAPVTTLPEGVEYALELQRQEIGP